MLFNSYVFVFLFLPLTLLGFYILGKAGLKKHIVIWLGVCSLAYYAWWNVQFLPLLLISVFVNFSLGRLILQTQLGSKKKCYLLAGIFFNLGILCYYKYANFFLLNISTVFDFQIPQLDHVLPLAISFYTFIQIAYLVDAYRNEIVKYTWSEYLLFVTFFPHLIAGPIIHHSEMMPQFERTALRIRRTSFIVGITVFILGLGKKVLLADNLSAYSNHIFDFVAAGGRVSFFDSWLGALAYTFQLYFDFSGYSDMAIGLSKIFGIRFPTNFNSPYKAPNIIEFWRRWHITLSRFLRDYLYIALGGSRRGPIRRHVNLMLTMLLGGLWHGAGWTFVAWGALHGFYLVVNHLWQTTRLQLHFKKQWTNWYYWSCRIITFVSVVCAWVFFRSASFPTAFELLKCMFGYNGISFDSYTARKIPLFWILGSLFITWYLPNTLDVFKKYGITLESQMNEKKERYRQFYESLGWRPNYAWATVYSVLVVFCLMLLSRHSEFIYYQF